MASIEMRFHPRKVFGVGVVLVIILVTLTGGSNGALASDAETPVRLPPGFATAIIIRGLVYPSDMELLPSGDLLITEKGVGERSRGVSHVRLVRSGVLQEQPVLTLFTNVNQDSGLLGIVADPDFVQNHYFYVWYATGIGSKGWHGKTSLRLSRFALDEASGRADAGGEHVLLDNVPWANAHSGGGLIFDAQGDLYISIGDARERDAVQDPRGFEGKVLRIRPLQGGYAIPADNPFRQVDDARPEIYALGLRNPFRMTRHSDGRILLGDVGAEDWEEIDLLKAGANYGWPEREGPCIKNSGPPCSPAPAKYTDPALYYRHSGGGAVTALAFYEGDRFPDEYRDDLFYADFDQATISAADVNQDGFTIQPFVSGLAGIVDLIYANNGLYYLDIYNGEVGLIYYAESARQIPEAKLTVDNTFGPAPLPVNFSAHGSSDPNGLALRYDWDYGDGSAPVVTVIPTTSHQYGKDGTYTARLKVTNPLNVESPEQQETIVVYSGEVPQIELVNPADPKRTQFHGGDSWTYGVIRKAGSEGLDSDTPYRWRVDLHHNQHSHPVLVDKMASDGALAIDATDHPDEWNIWFRFYLTTKTHSGQEFTIHRELFPAFSLITVDSVPRSAAIELNGAPQATEFQRKAIVGMEQTLEAPGQVLAQGGIGTFDHWHVFGSGWPVSTAAQSKDYFEPKLTINVPVTSTSYVAYYAYTHPANQVWLPAVAR